MRPSRDRFVEEELSGRHTSLFPVREFVRDRAVGTELTAQEAEDVVLAVSDACALLVRHSLDTVIEQSWEAGRNEILVTVEGPRRHPGLG